METIVKITWDKPQMKEWLCADNIKIALSKYCENTTFEVEELIEVGDEVVEDEDNDVNEIDIEQIKVDLANKEQQLSDLLKFVEINDGYHFDYLEHEIDILKTEIENIKAYLTELTDDDCECPFCKIDELEAENEGLCDENINLCLQLKEKEQDIECFKCALKDSYSENEKLKRENVAHVNSLEIMRETVKIYISLLSNFR